MSYATVSVSVDTSFPAPLRVLLRPGRRGVPGSASLAVLPYHERSFDVLSFAGTEAHFVKSTRFDVSDFRQLTDCHGCLGVICVKAETFVGFVTSVRPVGKLEGAQIFRVTQVRFYSLLSPETDSYSSEYAEAADPPAGASAVNHPCVQVAKFYASGSCYFSRDRDLTLSCQRRALEREGAGALISHWDHVDERLLWNYYPLKDLVRLQRLIPGFVDRHRLLVPIIQGYVDIRDLPVQGKAVRVALISRLSRERGGPRYNARGVDDAGNVANFVETEQLVYHKDFAISYVQVRGSVPVFWEQRGFQVGSSPRIELSRGDEATAPAFRRHFANMVAMYGFQHVVDLLTPKSQDGVLVEAYLRNINLLKSQQVEYTNFDFNTMCRSQNYDGLNTLLHELGENLANFQFFLFNTAAKETIMKQRGVFRTNCVDCLDRTNVAQAAIAQAALAQQLAAVSWGVSAKSCFAACLSEMWADNGDLLSRLYAGTGALRSEYTRTGKRTLTGMMDDVLKNVNRFVASNFQDDGKQAVIDLVLGRYQKDQMKQVLVSNPLLQAIDEEVRRSTAECTGRKTFLIHTGTWNVNTRRPQGESLLPWLTFEGLDSPDVYALGFQELVELSAKQVVKTDTDERVAWEQLLLRTLNARGGSGGEARYVLLRADQLVGVCLFIFVKLEHVPHIANVEVSIEKTGFSGMAGNKGGVGIRFDLHETSLCFLSAHFAAGQKNVEDRNRDFATIADNMAFSRGWRLADHDLVFWLGDFNYRLELDGAEVRRKIQAGDYASLLRFDQLNAAREQGRVFPFCTEGHISFAPTYKYDLGTQNYDTSEKMRIPAWTDRILWYGDRAAQVFYDRAELLSSDHRPVKALFHVEVAAVDHPLLDSIVAEIYKKYTQQREAPSEADPVGQPAAPARTTQAQRLSQNQPKPAAAPPAQPAPAKPKEGTLIDLFDDSPPPLPPSTPAPAAPTSTPSPFAFDVADWTSAMHAPAPTSQPTPASASPSPFDPSQIQQQFPGQRAPQGPNYYAVSTAGAGGGGGGDLFLADFSVLPPLRPASPAVKGPDPFASLAPFQPAAAQPPRIAGQQRQQQQLPDPFAGGW